LIKSQKNIGYAKSGKELQSVSEESDPGREESGRINAIKPLITRRVHRDVQEKHGISNPNAKTKIKRREEYLKKTTL